MIYKLFICAALFLVFPTQFLAQLEVGTIAPVISVDTIINNDKSKSFIGTSEGEVIVLDFWTLWCKPCLAGLPNLNKLEETFVDKNVRIIAITDEPLIKVTNFLKETNYIFSVGIDSSKSNFKSFKIHSIPQMYIINTKGVVVYAGHHIDADMIQEVLLTNGFVNEVDRTEKPKVITVGNGTNPGEDPLYNGMKEMLELSKEKPTKPLTQFIIRPSLINHLGVSGQRHYKNGFVGITWYGYTISSFYDRIYDLKSPPWIMNYTEDTSRYDIIYYNKAESIQSAKLEIIKKFEAVRNTYLDSITGPRMVFELYLKEKSDKLIDGSKLKVGAKNAYLKLSWFQSFFDYHNDHIYLLDSSLKNLLISDKTHGYGELRQFHILELERYLADIGIGIRLVSRNITTYEILNE